MFVYVFVCSPFTLSTNSIRSMGISGDIGNSLGMLGGGDVTANGHNQQPELSKIRNLSNAFPTLSLKDLSLLGVIGGGGFGQVWKGTWGGTPVAVKMLNNLMLPTNGSAALPEQVQLLNAFEEEVTMLAQLRHPNICLFLGVCLEPPHRAIVTELVSRGSLWDCLRIPGLFQVRFGVGWCRVVRCLFPWIHCTSCTPCSTFLVLLFLHLFM
jgi:serine/threonine protein kinase